MPSRSLQEMIPTREWGDPMDGPAAPGLRRFSIEHLPNPLLALGLTDVVWARGFLHKIEEELQERHRLRMSQPLTMTAAGGLAYAPTSRVESDLRELQRKQKAEAQVLAQGAKPTPAEGGVMLTDASERLAEELWASSAGNLELATSVLDRFWAKFSEEKFRTPDLMSLLLVAHEEVLWEQDGMAPDLGGAQAGAGRMRMSAPSLHLQVQAQAGEEGEAGANSPFGTPMQVVASVPQGPAGSAVVMPLMRRGVGELSNAAIAATSAKSARSQAAREEVEVRLISIREMLWHYFQAYPKDYPAALAAVLGLSIAQVSDPGTLDDRIAFEVARTGSWSLALRVWQEIVKHQKIREANGGNGAWASAQNATQEALAQGMVPPKPGAGRPWWSLSANWEGLNVGAALRALAKMIFAS